MSALHDWMHQDFTVEPVVVPFNSFVPYDYQLELFKALRSGNWRHFCIAAHRDYGKDFLVFQHVLYEMFLHPANYHYVFQTYANAKEVIWNGITYDGVPLLDYIPPELLIDKPNRSELLIRMRTKCGRVSTLKFVGSNNYNTLRGPKPKGIVYSEAAYLLPGIFEVYKPVIRNRPDAWEIHISTPCGDNHFKDTYNIARNNPKEWYCGFFPINVTGKLTDEDMEAERRRGTSEEMIQQEYYCSFERGIEGTYYGRYIHEARLDGRIGDYRWDSSLPVYTAWDLGQSNNRILFFQVKNDCPYVIDSYHESDGGLEQKARYIHNKPYDVVIDFLPHDGKYKEQLKGRRIEDLAKDLGLKPQVIERGSPLQRIEYTKVNFSKIRINENCKQLISDLTNYRQRYDTKICKYTGHPVKDLTSHYADAFGLMMLSLQKIKRQFSVNYEELQEAYYHYNYGRRNTPKGHMYA